MKKFLDKLFNRDTVNGDSNINSTHLNLGGYLIDKKAITVEQLEMALNIQKEHGHKLGELLAEIDAIGEAEILALLTQFLKVKGADLDEKVFPLKTQPIFTKKFMIEKCFAPFEFSGNIMSIAVADINNKALIEEITDKIKAHNEEIHADFYLTLSSMLKRFINNSYSKFPHKSSIILSKKKTFGEYLLENNIVTAEQLDEVLKYQKEYVHKRLGEALADLNVLDKRAVLTELAKHENCEYAELPENITNVQPQQYFSKSFMHENKFIPFEIEDNELKVALGNIYDDDLKDEINTELLKHNLKPKFYLSSNEEIEKLTS